MLSTKIKGGSGLSTNYVIRCTKNPRRGPKHPLAPLKKTLIGTSSLKGSINIVHMQWLDNRHVLSQNTELRRELHAYFILFMWSGERGTTI